MRGTGPPGDVNFFKQKELMRGAGEPRPQFADSAAKRRKVPAKL